MKLEMNSAEATALFTGVANTSRVTELEEQLRVVRSDLESAEVSRTNAWNENDKTRGELYELQRNTRDEISSLKREVARLLDLLKPYPKERKISLMFAHFRGGQKIQAIKSLREALNLGLKEAKDIVEGDFKDGTHPQLFALSKVFAGIDAGLPIDHLRTELVKSGMVDELVGKRADDGETLANELNGILYGEFHNYY